LVQTIKGDPAKQTIRRLRGCPPDVVAAVYGAVTQINMLSEPILALARDNIRKYQVIYSKKHGVDSLQNGEIYVPDDTVMALYQGELVLVGIRGKECPVDPNADTSHDIGLPYKICEIYTFVFRGTIVGFADFVNASFIGHTCSNATAKLLRLSVKNDTREKIILGCGSPVGSDGADQQQHRHAAD
jgi:hypothetical protein